MAITESSSQNKKRIYDPFRQMWVVATPEEIVRQKLLQKMMQELSYPKELISVERALSDLCIHKGNKKTPSRRVDIVCFARKGPSHFIPLVIIECKESHSLAKEALSQVKGYNAFLGAPFIAVSSPEGETLAYYLEGKEHFLPYLPPYPALLQAVSHG